MPSEPETLLLVDDGVFPNSWLPALVYRGVLSRQGNLAAGFEELFDRYDWPAAWRNGLFGIHHYHSTAHEVLGIYSGEVTAQLGGPGGPKVTARAGDALVVPAGVAHKNVAQSSDFRCVGAYPTGTSNDMQTGAPGERPQTDRNIAAVPMPSADPVFGPLGPLVRLWQREKLAH